MSFVENVRAHARPKAPLQNTKAKAQGDEPIRALFGNRQRYRRTDAEAWIVSRTVRSTSWPVQL